MTAEEKPPIGLKPKEIYNKECHENRIQQIILAMTRYSKAEKTIPLEWIEELSSRIWRL